MIDPVLSLSFNLHAQKGTYALLVGSGISRTAGIPTGWEITLDLVRKLAHIEKESCDGDEAAWYEKRFGKDPDYSELLGEIAPTSAAQQQLLRGYFEPSEEEREDGKKLPTAGHKAIARLVASGHVRVIVTTNFDRLVETAIQAEGIKPVVISSPDAVLGAPPLAHSPCTIIKVHGDYLDQRIKNSPEALSVYDETMDRLLDQIFDEYGLIVCGWSADWDVALRNALNRCRSRRYPLYWTALFEPIGQAKELVAFHRAQVIRIEGADGFFSSLLEKVEALDEFDRPHPMSTQAAVVTLKRYLSEDRHRIQLRDLLVNEACQACSSIDTAFAAVDRQRPEKEPAWQLMQSLDASVETLVHLLATGSFHGQRGQAKALHEAFNVLLGHLPASKAGIQVWVNFRHYPLLLAIYATGVAATASDNYAVLREIASQTPKFRVHGDIAGPLPGWIYTHSTIDRNSARTFILDIPDMPTHKTPVSEHLLNVLSGPLEHLIASQGHLEKIFDNFEYLWCLLHADAKLLAGATLRWALSGISAYRHVAQMRRQVLSSAISIPSTAAQFCPSMTKRQANRAAVW